MTTTYVGPAKMASTPALHILVPACRRPEFLLLAGTLVTLLGIERAHEMIDVAATQPGRTMEDDHD